MKLTRSEKFMCLILGIWISTTIACFGTHNSDPLMFAQGATILIVIVWIIKADEAMA